MNFDLLDGLAKLIASAGLGIDYTPDEVYTDSQTAIVLKLRPDKPDRIVTLTAVNQGDSITMPDGQVMVQLRGRGFPGDPVDVDNLLDSVFPILQGLTGYVCGTVTITQMFRRVSTPMGTDALKRDDRIDQYYLDVSVAPSVLRPAGGSW
ncbi:hypothetical protein KPL76_06180 [Subtercola sp. PAMC28395]|uniref:minor capsid protein n=1 Tax=Subtercola sp. PAMC28395 TaxID=2846775 RepID=UPI001C0D4D8C|nr:minor capsid protein [Subtercola sp. PAMC28395]QWT24941.1 hypothetical protein KPL76_06180 [Subtercola sp. PAMC28395]